MSRPRGRRAGAEPPRAEAAGSGLCSRRSRPRPRPPRVRSLPHLPVPPGRGPRPAGAAPTARELGCAGRARARDLARRPRRGGRPSAATNHPGAPPARAATAGCSRRHRELNLGLPMLKMIRRNAGSSVLPIALIVMLPFISPAVVNSPHQCSNWTLQRWQEEAFLIIRKLLPTPESPPLAIGPNKVLNPPASPPFQRHPPLIHHSPAMAPPTKYSSPLLALIYASYLSLNTSQPNLTKNCWLCLSPSLPIYEPVARR
ncbi:uncharacterized protein [Dasypus novemcinctus]|uniref:uncharacterized protein n=1 Tax=Dasypus novemcinctus TaxID=9361 RepID=UPI0039C937CB